jgi:cyclic dehypoxanthinyl futalosine synthase
MGIIRKQALEFFQGDDLIGIGMEADTLRQRLHPEGVVSYAIECSIDCTALATGARVEGNAGEASLDGLYKKIAGTVDLGSTGVRLVGGTVSIGSKSKVCGIDWFEGLLRGIRQRFPSVWIETLSAAEILSLANGCGLDLRQTIARLHDAGLSSIACDDAQPTCSLTEWIAVHRTAHGLGMRTVATMVFGAGETLEQRVDTLAAIHQLQQETGGFTAFVPVAAAAPSGRELDAVTAVEQLKTLAIARVFLDNIQNIQWSGAAQGLKVLQMGLRFGANDAGSLAPVEIGAGSVFGEYAAAAANHPSEEDLRRIIRDAGFQPAQRDTPYRMMFLN